MGQIAVPAELTTTIGNAVAAVKADIVRTGVLPDQADAAYTWNRRSLCTSLDFSSS